MSDKHQGGCLCGQVRYEAKGEPIRTTTCHCRFCQRATGSAFLVEPSFPQSHLKLITGQVKTYEHRSSRSGKAITSHFCENCGTTLYFTIERSPENAYVFAGTFDDPNWFERSTDANKHIFTDYAQRGTVIPAGVNTYPEHIDNLDGTKNSPVILEEPRLIE